MATTADYLTQLQADKQILVDNLVVKGVEATSDETFTTLAPKVADIQSGGADFEITNAYYLFEKGNRLDIKEKLIKLLNNVTTYERAFQSCPRTFTEVDLSGKINEYTTNFSYVFNQDCVVTIKLDNCNFSNVTTFSWAWNNCNNLLELPEINAGSAIRIDYVLNNCLVLTNFGGFKDLGKAYLTTRAENYSDYTLNISTCTSLTYESLINVINGLYDIATKGCNPQSLVLGETNLAKLTEEEIAIATNKGWNVS